MALLVSNGERLFSGLVCPLPELAQTATRVVSVLAGADPQHAAEGTGSLTLCPARRMAHNAAKPRTELPLLRDGLETRGQAVGVRQG